MKKKSLPIQSLIAAIVCFLTSITPAFAGAVFVDSLLTPQTALTVVPTIGGAMLTKGEDMHFSNLREDFLPEHSCRVENAMQFAPAVIMLGMKAMGVESQSSWGKMAGAGVLSFTTMATLVKLTKHAADVTRPDGTDRSSFPSGHTATSFMFATMLHHEYGDRYPWLSLAGYGMAGTTGFLRIRHNRHWMSDVMAGAGIGIVSTEIGYLLSDMILGKERKKQPRMDEEWTERPSFIALRTAANIPLGEICAAEDLTLKSSSSGTIGIEGAWFPRNHIGFGGQVSLTEQRFYANRLPQDDVMTSMSMMAGPFLSYTLPGQRFAVVAKCMAGYAHYFPFTATDSNAQSINFGKNGGWQATAGASLNYRATPSLSYGLQCDYNNMPSPARNADNRTHQLSIAIQMSWHP